MNLNLILNIFTIAFSFLGVFYFAKRGVESYRKVREKILHENEFYTELILGLESAGRSVSRTSVLKRETRVAVWELFTLLRIQPGKENKSVVLHRKILESKQVLYRDLEEAKVYLEILPFVGIIGTLLGFMVPYFANIVLSAEQIFQVTGAGFSLAASSTMLALFALIHLKQKYEADVLAKFDHYECQVQSLEKILVDGGGFVIMEKWLHTWPEDEIKSEGPVPGQELPDGTSPTQVRSVAKDAGAGTRIGLLPAPQSGVPNRPNSDNTEDAPAQPEEVAKEKNNSRQEVKDAEVQVDA